MLTGTSIPKAYQKSFDIWVEQKTQQVLHLAKYIAEVRRPVYF